MCATTKETAQNRREEGSNGSHTFSAPSFSPYRT